MTEEGSVAPRLVTRLNELAAELGAEHGSIADEHLAEARATWPDH